MPVGTEKNTLLGAAGAGGAGERGVQVGSDRTGYKNVMQYITIDSPSDSTDFGDLLTNQVSSGGSTSNAANDRGIMNGLGNHGGTNYETIEYITISSTGNSADFGNSFSPASNKAAASNATNERACFMGGGPPTDYTGSPRQDVISYLTMSSLGDSADFGNMNFDRSAAQGLSNGTNERMLAACGRWYWPNQGSLNHIEYITINSAGNGTDFGDYNVDLGYNYASGTSNDTNERGVWAGGFVGWPHNTTQNRISYVSINSAGNVSDFGNLITARSTANEVSSGLSERAVWGGGAVGEGASFPINMDYITINSTGDAADFGDLLSGEWSSSHGLSNMCP